MREYFTNGLYQERIHYFFCRVSMIKNSKKSSAVVDERVPYTHVTVVYTDNVSEYFEALRVTKKGVIIGRFIPNSQGGQEFVECGFISRLMVKKIIPNSKDGDAKNLR